MQRIWTVALLLCLFFGTALAGPDTAADFTLRTPDGTPVTLSLLRERKPVLLVFWASWCPECKAAIPRLNALHGGPAGEKLQILAINFRETAEKVTATVRSRGIRYPVLLDERGTVAHDYGIVGIPTYVLVGRDGAVVYRGNSLPRDLSSFL